MAEMHVVTNLETALLARLHPAITRWNRLVGRPRRHDFDRALHAEVRDALWMLSRQWQLGEFVGDDAGSPVLARACLDLRTLDREPVARRIRGGSFRGTIMGDITFGPDGQLGSSHRLFTVQDGRIEVRA